MDDITSEMLRMQAEDDKDVERDLNMVQAAVGLIAYGLTESARIRAEQRARS